MQTQRSSARATQLAAKPLKFIQDVMLKNAGMSQEQAEAVCFILGDSCGPQRPRASHQRGVAFFFNWTLGPAPHGRIWPKRRENGHAKRHGGGPGRNPRTC